jgi:hypothetical protein
MFKRLFVTSAAAAAVSVPLAGAACADPPSDPGSNGNGIGAGGVPQKAGETLSEGVTPNANPNPGGVGPVTPGSAFNVAKDAFPGVSTPVAYGNTLTVFWSGAPGVPPHTWTDPDLVAQTEPFGPTPPGMGVKAFTPGCSHGRSGITQDDATKCAP